MSGSFRFRHTDFSTPIVIPYYGECWYVALGYARSLGRLGVPVYGGSHLRQSATESSRYLREIFHLESMDEPNEYRILESLINVSGFVGGKPVLAITLDKFAKFVARHASILKEYFLLPGLDINLVNTLCDKKRTHFLASQCGIPTVRTHCPESIEDVIEFSKTAVFPIAIKAADFSVSDGRPPQKLIRVKSREELIGEYSELLREADRPNVILQEYLYGVGIQNWIFCGYFDHQSRPMFTGSGKKLRQLPTIGGPTTFGVSAYNQRLISSSVNFLQAIGYSGIVDIDYIYDPEDDLYKVLDVNPRIGSNFRMITHHNGLDVVRVMYLDLTGQSVPTGSLIEGRKWVVENQDFFSFRASHKEGSLSCWSWFKSLIGVKEGAWFAVDDPLPFFKNAFGILKLMLKRLRSVFFKK